MSKKVQTTKSKLQQVKKEVKPEKKVTTKVVAEKAEVKKAPEKITSKEVKKIAAKKAPEKITSKEVKKIAAKKAPEKITNKEVKKIAAKKAPEKIASKEVKKIATKKAPEKITSKEVKKIAIKKAPVVETKLPKSKTVKEEFLTLSLDECFERLNNNSISLNYQDCYNLLLVSEDLMKEAKRIVSETENVIESEAIVVAMLYETLNKVCDTMEIKAVEFKDMRKAIEINMKHAIVKEFEVNSKAYLEAFALMEKVLMIGQRRIINEAKTVSELLGIDIESFVAHFMKLAYEVLPEYQHKDVAYYEDFMFAVLSQYTDIYPIYEQALLLDVADLYIKHNDFLHGDDCYNYILRENQIKDYIYYRFAHVYEAFDLGKAKAIAQGALQIVDERFDYHLKLVEIANK
ncbi:MAG: neurofilament protein [Erysipelotrichaceae bacterium]